MLAALAVAAGAAGPAHATFITESGTYGTTLTDFGLTGEDGATPARVTLDGFDSALGTLHSVAVSLTGWGNFAGTITNKSAQTRDFTMIENLAMNWDGVGQSMLSGLVLDLSATQTYSGLKSHAVGTFDPADDIRTTSMMSTSPGDLLAFEDTPVMAGFYTTTGTTIQGHGGNLVADVDTMAGFSVSVTFDYSSPPRPIPEPSGLPLLGIGLSAVLLLRRRRPALRR